MTILKQVAARTKRPEQWLSVDELELDYAPEQIDAAIRTLVDRGWLSTSAMTLHSVSITAAGQKRLAQS
ncbi:MAG TPA: hypothetical protein VFB13_12055 [Reyranella sp.]|nr:hypothetical protein [Reyranella sp.]